MRRKLTHKIAAAIVSMNEKQLIEIKIAAHNNGKPKLVTHELNAFFYTIFEQIMIFYCKKFANNKISHLLCG